MPKLPTTTSGGRSTDTTSRTCCRTALGRRAFFTGRASNLVAREDARRHYSSSTGCVSASSRFRSSPRAAPPVEQPRRFGLSRRGLLRDLKSRSLFSTAACPVEARSRGVTFPHAGPAECGGTEAEMACSARVVVQAQLVETERGLVPEGDGWFVLNAREAEWWTLRSGGGALCDVEGEALDGAPYFPQLGINLTLLESGEPMTMYHWEVDQEDFLVLSGEALLVIEGEERAIRQWDFVHCPPGVNHAIIGVGTAPCLVLAVGARVRRRGHEWGAYTVDETALRHGAGVASETTKGREAYARFPPSEPTRYREGWLPD